MKPDLTEFFVLLRRSPKSLSELLGHPAADGFLSDKPGNNLTLTDPERYDRLQKAAEHGADGSTHREAIDDQRELVAIVFSSARRELSKLANKHDLTDDITEVGEEILDAKSNLLLRELDGVELWHRAAGTLEQEVG